MANGFLFFVAPAIKFMRKTVLFLKFILLSNRNDFTKVSSRNDFTKNYRLWLLLPLLLCLLCEEDECEVDECDFECDEVVLECDFDDDECDFDEDL